MREPSGLKDALFTQSLCPESIARVAPVLASHNRAVLSADEVTMRAPSGAERRTDDAIPMA